MKQNHLFKRAPLFKGEKYDLWMLKMTSFLEYNVDLLIFVKKSKPRHILLCSLSKEETSKVHAMANTKDIWETITLSYEGSKEVKQNMLTLLKTQHEMFRIEENESIQLMVIRLQTIINNFRSSGTVITMFLEELVDILIIHDKVLQGDDKTTKGKSLTLKAFNKAKKTKSLKVFEENEDTSDDSESNYEDSAFITQKFKKMCKRKRNSTKDKKYTRETKGKHTCFG
ncbi:hypothetical protein PHAVU_004G059100 [Phaseolus vulgaris]|uniref:DUF4219 domain-containing protein n=1 Tax=Phaseolus vulgaris TaxID=3885 RepID=V7C2I3_PHAVU|nr:hypothetical protein PHAVU_004G059100g [Phaseolus vulgaris]ESW23578.1 hypothetical protein PHAVU_004G059100g [Phaseolus vulgaris]